ncbi:right-handed parallel beta-helix repeat-containing protein [Aquimarina sp. 2-A2]|uniref:right-handed parallel beta-helix repeat-containing protein n=1 Tax=Aquimarina sp. 2-A2 TaxID=3382644 RepID=UPI00387F2AC1
MKRLSRLFTLNFLLLILLISCQKEEIEDSFDESVLENISETNSIVRSTTVCRFTLAGLQPNASIGLSCILDLKDETLNLPPNVKIKYLGGSFINGTINVSGGEIDSRLMTSTARLTGTYTLTHQEDVVEDTPATNNEGRVFDPNAEGIVQGVVSDAVARENKKILQEFIDKAARENVTVVSLNAIDAYFKIDDPSGRITAENMAITLPSNFKLKMGENTHLRMQPNNYKKTALISITNGNSDVTIEGGNLYGDRDKHNYSGGGTHEWGHIIRIKGASDVLIKGVRFEQATGDALHISELYHAFDSRHIESSNIRIVDNSFLRSRRINLTIVSGNNVTIENNTFVDGGIDTRYSKGTAPRANINLEPHREWNNGIVGGTLREYQKVHHIYIRNNTQIGRGDFYASHGDGPIVIEGNKMEATISFSVANGVRIANNTFEASDAEAANGNAITAGVAYATEHPLVFDNEVYGNTITGYHTGINAGGQNTKIYENYIEGYNGIVLSSGRGIGLHNTTISNNTIKVTKYGISARKSLDKVYITNNTIESESGPLVLSGINIDAGQSNQKLYVKNNVLRGKRNGSAYGFEKNTISNSNGIVLEQNNINGGFEINGSNKLDIVNNKIYSEKTHGIRFISKATTNSKIKDNDITINGSQYSRIQCIKEDVNLNSSVAFTNNSCN